MRLLQDLELEDVWAVVKPIGKRAAKVVDALAALGLPSSQILRTTPANSGQVAAETALAGGASRILVVGGDGTLRTVAGVLAGSPAVLGVIPTGAANLAARNLGIPQVLLRSALSRALCEPGRPIDLGLARLDGGAPLPFVAVAGIGNDAQSLLDASPELKRRLGWLAYFAAGIHQLRRPGVAMRLDDGPQRDSWCVLAASCAKIPPGAAIAPGALPDDGLLHILQVHLKSTWNWASIAAAGLTHWNGPTPGISRKVASSLTITAAQPSPVQLDGDVVGSASQLQLEIRPGALRIA